jgi:hypothetical protein
MTLQPSARLKNFCRLSMRLGQAMIEHTTQPVSTHDDPIVAEVRATRAALSAASGDDLARIAAALRALEATERAAGREIIVPPARPSAAA